VNNFNKQTTINNLNQTIMKKTILIFALISMACCTQVSALWTNKTMVFGGLTRSYRVYQSPNYNPANPASLLIALHGLGDNMTNFSTIGFNVIADTANIICIFPQAVTDALISATAWNSGAGQYGYYPNSTVNDIGFINALMDTAIAKYSINIQRIYLCGFSMGGFMTERMALQSNSRIAAFGSMSGTIGNGITTYNPGRHVPIAHFHGTSDSTVYYLGDLYGLDPDSLIHFWTNNNGCVTTPTTYTYPNTGTDTIHVDRFEYSNGDPQSDVWFFKMHGAGHTLLYQPASDITEIYELWLFFTRHKKMDAGINDQSDFSSTIQVFPNPTNDKITISGINENCSNKTSISVYNLQGQLLLQQAVNQETAEVDLSSLAKGMYILKLNSNNNNNVVRRIVKK
jgi:polyhydroxybutyrate depolymerase